VTVKFGLHAIACVVAVTACSPDLTLMEDSFTGPDGLIAAEKRSGDGDSAWVVTSGSLFRDDDQGWTGVPDDGRHEGDTGSAVFRMVSERRDFSDVDVSLGLDVERLVTTERTPARGFDGAHIFLRYQSDRQLYAVSVDRRDATMVIKKKCDGGESNGGTYFDLSAVVPNVPIPFGAWQRVSVAVHNQPDGTVAIFADRDGHVVSAVDRGTGCPPLHQGAVGIRGDNAELRFDGLSVSSRSEPLPPP
jgi:hypothetical protein